MRALFMVVPVAMLSSCAHRFECTAHGGSEVLRVTTEHFIVTSDQDRETLQAESRKLEQLWDAWSAFFGSAPQSKARIHLILAREGEADEFVPGSAGFVKYSVPSRVFSEVMSTKGLPADKAYLASANAHELVHLVSGFWLPRQPRWIAEGLAGYLQDATFVHQNMIRMGRWQDGAIDVDSLEVLWAWDDMREVGDAQHLRYRSAWAWIHYLSNHEEERLGRLWKVLPGMASPRAAFETIFPVAEWPALHEKVKAYLREGRYRGWETRLLRNPDISEVTTLEPWAVHLLRRDYLESDAARAAEVDAAFALKTPATASMTLARFETDFRGPQLSEVLDALPGDPQAMRLAASSPDVPSKQRLQLLETALEALPDDVNVLADFASAALARTDPRALQAAEKAIAMAPWWPRPHFQRAEALGQAHRCDEAVTELDAMVGLAVDGAPRLLNEIARARKLAFRCTFEP